MKRLKYFDNDALAAAQVKSSERDWLSFGNFFFYSFRDWLAGKRVIREERSTNAPNILFVMLILKDRSSKSESD